jgi:hypothetical protein
MRPFLNMFFFFFGSIQFQVKFQLCVYVINAKLKIVFYCRNKNLVGINGYFKVNIIIVVSCF